VSSFFGMDDSHRDVSRLRSCAKLLKPITHPFPPILNHARCAWPSMQYCVAVVRQCAAHALPHAHCAVAVCSSACSVRQCGSAQHRPMRYRCGSVQQHCAWQCEWQCVNVRRGGSEVCGSIRGHVHQCGTVWHH
jgi:hypothetical protein